MKQLRQTVRRLILEACKRPHYFGPAGSGIIVLCTEDSSIYLQRRSMRVAGGRGQWAFPGGGYHPTEEEEFYSTPIPEKFRIDPNDPVLKKNAIKELEEEAGKYGLPKYYMVDELISYEDCGFIYKTFIVDITLDEKYEWQPEAMDDCAWEVMDQGWFHKDDWERQDLFFGFTPVLINVINGKLR